MKLFKKLAAVMLVAALALTMVGCGRHQERDQRLHCRFFCDV